jgi:hypothetical protein
MNAPHDLPWVAADPHRVHLRSIHADKMGYAKAMYILPVAGAANSSVSKTCACVGAAGAELASRA